MPNMEILLPGTKKVPGMAGAKALLAYGLDNIGSIINQGMVIPHADMTTLINNVMIGTSTIGDNRLGLFTKKGGIVGTEFSITSLNKQSHLWSKRKDGGQFIPKGRGSANRASFTLTPVEYDGKQLPDEFFGSDWEALFGTEDPFQMLNTANGKVALAMIVQTILFSLSQDMYMLLMYGDHPFITTSDTDGNYKVTTAEWADFKDQMIDTVGGFITNADYLRSLGIDNFGLTIGTTSGTAFTGDIIAEFNKVKAKMTPKFKVVSKTPRFGMPIMLVTTGIYEAYKAYLIDTYNTIPVSYQMLTTGTDGTTYGGEVALKWDGFWIVEFNEMANFDAIAGCTTHMILATMPGNIPILHGTNSERTQYGFRVQQSDRIADKGAVFMYGVMKLGTGFVDPDLVVYGVSRTAIANTTP